MKKHRFLAAALTCGMLLSSPPSVPASAESYRRVSVHDPSVVKLNDGSYYIIGSHLGAARSGDLMNWTTAANSAAGSTQTTFFKNIYADLAIPEKWSNTSAGYNLAGNLWAPDIIWNPDMQKYCMYLSVNGADWHSSIVLCTADNTDGPYTDMNGNSAVYAAGGDNIAGNIGQRLMSNYQWSCNSRPNTAQGHNSVLMDDDGKLYCIYHNKFDDNYGGHEVRVHQMIMSEDGWPTAASYEYAGETLSANGHTTEAIVGDYELIWHNPNQKFVNEQSADVEKPVSPQ